MNPSDSSSTAPTTSQAPPAGDPGVTYEPSREVVRAELSEPLPDESPPEQALPRRRRVRLPLILFVLTCFSTFLAGATDYLPHYALHAIGLWGWPPSAMPLRQAIYAGWSEGLLYMACVLAILLTHEMGHFVMTLVYRVRASLPFFIPFPISPIGTMGAVIAMDSRSANRREIFDIGLAGPIAGLLVALPIMWIGVQNVDLQPSPGEPTLQAPLVMRLAIDYVHPGKYDSSAGFPLTRVNAWFMAGWVGLLVTGLNMLPVSQLDGGHVTYALFGRAAHWIARGFMLLAVVYMGLMYYVYSTPPTYVLMAILVLVIGTDHPRTSDDTARLGPWRIALGCASLLIPIFCFVPNLQL
ncbi:MAG: site-2 protease family protein [Pirellulaceae bacterium]